MQCKENKTIKTMTNLIVEAVGTAFVPHVDNSINPKHSFNLNQIFDKGCNFFLNEVSRTGSAKLMGYRYNLKPYLKKFLYKQYGQWNEYFAPNKTLLRRSIYGRIEQIIEIN